MEDKKYYVNENMRFNLDSMHTKVECLIYDIMDGDKEKVELMGKTMGLNELYEFKDELENLMSKASYKVTGKEYGRIKAISDERNLLRYAKCLETGMSENDASLAFFE